VPAKTEEKKEAPAPAPAEKVAPAKGGIGKWIPAIAALVLAPGLSWGVVNYVMLPKLEKQIAVPAAKPAGDATAADDSAPAPAEAGKDAGKEGAKDVKDGGNSYDFSNVVVNLAGTMGTRYLKTSFTITGPANVAGFKGKVEAKKAQLMDVNLNVLSGVTLSDLEEPGAKNVLRDKLVAAYNQVLGAHVVDQVYFSDFLIQ
jgi:flagellar FliL protein